MKLRPYHIYMLIFLLFCLEKVTKLGDYITNIKDVHGKRPYETILIGRVESVPTEATQTDSQTNSKAPTTDNKDGEKISEEQSQVASGRDLSESSAECKGHRGEDKCFRTGHISEVKSYLPDKRVIVSIPCSIHSSKPPLSGEPLLSYAITGTFALYFCIKIPFHYYDNFILHSVYSEYDVRVMLILKEN